MNGYMENIMSKVAWQVAKVWMEPLSLRLSSYQDSITDWQCYFRGWEGRGIVMWTSYAQLDYSLRLSKTATRHGNILKHDYIVCICTLGEAVPKSIYGINIKTAVCSQEQTNNVRKLFQNWWLRTTILLIETQQLLGKSWSIGTRNWRHPSQWHSNSIIAIKLIILITALARS